MGVFVPDYYAVGHDSLDNYIALMSGQAPNAETRADCSGQYDEFIETGPVGPYEQAVGHGCVYPASVKTLPGQLEGAGYSWKGYMQSMPRACAHAELNGPDPEQGEGTPLDPLDTYATRHNPFVWFKSITETQAYCEAHVVNLSALPGDLSSIATTPNLSFITPDVCYDGHDSRCVNPAEPAGFDGINAFLSEWVPVIVGSPAFKQDGLLIVTFDEADDGDTSACCGETTSGGGDVGTVMLSPLIKADTMSTMSYNHYSTLASIEHLFSLPLLGDAAEPGTTTFGSDIFNLYAPTAVTGAASSVTQTTAAVNASVNPDGWQVSECNFEYGTTRSYGSSVPCTSLPGSGNSAVAVSAAITGLTANTAFHFRIVATNAEGTSYGYDKQFITLPDAPTVATGSYIATSIPQTLTGTVNPNGGETSCEFEYGSTSLYGAIVPCSKPPGAGTGVTEVSVPVSGLSIGDTYHFRMVATNAGGTSYGEDRIFTAQPSPPTAITEGASTVTQTSANLSGKITPNGSTVNNCHFDYGTTTAYGSSVACSSLPGSGSSTVAVSAAVTGLAADTSYYYRIVATNSGGTAYGESQALTTELPTPTMLLPQIPGSQEVLRSDEQDAPATPEAKLVSTYLAVTRSGAVSIKVTCLPQETSCAGTITLKTLSAVIAHATTDEPKRTKAAILTLASAIFRVARGQTTTVKLRLSAKARALLTRSRVLRARATIVAHDPSGAIHTTQTIVTLRQAK